MNTIEFLRQLKKQYTFFGLTDDLEVFLGDFTVEMFKLNYLTLYPNGVEEFLRKLSLDISACSLEEFQNFYDDIAPYIKQSAKTTVVKNHIISACKDYILKHYKDLNIPKFKEVIFKGIVLDFQKDLQFPIRTEINEKNGTAEAAANSYIESQKNYSRHTIYYYTNQKLPKFNKEYQLFYLAFEAFHEECHCLISELIHNPTCFKEDIFDYAITRFYLEELDSSRFYYDAHYLTNKEEAKADLYGVAKTIAYLEEHIPAFPTNKIKTYANSITKLAHANQATTKKINRPITEQEWLEKRVEEGIKKYPYLLSGILTRAFNEDGSKKDFITLVNDQKALKDANENPLLQKDIERFYSILQYKALHNLSDEERRTLFQNPDLQKELQETILNYIQYIKEKIEEFKEKKTSIYALLYKPQTIQIYKRQLKEVQNWSYAINQIKEEGVTYGL